MSLKSEQLSNLQKVASEAVSVERITSIPAEVTIAQWALESGWGVHSPGNNCFGIKKYPGCPGVQILNTNEWYTEEEVAHILKRGGTLTLVQPSEPDAKGRRLYVEPCEFATFPTIRACFMRRALLLCSGRYMTAWRKLLNGGQLEPFVREIGPIYATDPKYADKILSIASMPEVVEVLAKLRQS